MVSYKDRNPKKVKVILDELSKTYVDIASDERKKRLNAGLKFLESQYPKINSNLENSEQKLVEFREKNNVVDPLSDAQSARNKIISIKLVSCFDVLLL